MLGEQEESRVGGRDREYPAHRALGHTPRRTSLPGSRQPGRLQRHVKPQPEGPGRRPFNYSESPGCRLLIGREALKHWILLIKNGPPAQQPDRPNKQGIMSLSPAHHTPMQTGHRIRGCDGPLHPLPPRGPHRAKGHGDGHKGIDGRRRKGKPGGLPVGDAGELTWRARSNLSSELQPCVRQTGGWNGPHSFLAPELAKGPELTHL